MDILKDPQDETKNKMNRRFIAWLGQCDSSLILHNKSVRFQKFSRVSLRGQRNEYQRNTRLAQGIFLLSAQPQNILSAQFGKKRLLFIYLCGIHPYWRIGSNHAYYPLKCKKF